MTGSIADKARGLVDTNGPSEQPGALTIAENVVVEVGGTLAIRPTLTLVENVSATEKPRTLVMSNGIPGTIHLAADGVTYELRINATDITGAIQPPDDYWNDATNGLIEEHPWFNARDFLYLSTDDGWMRGSVYAASWARAGIDYAIIPDRLTMMGVTVGVGPDAPTWTGLVAYRLCVTRRTTQPAPSYVPIMSRQSVPTVRYATLGNLIGGANPALLNADRYYIRGLLEGDVVGWYRTRGSGGPTVPPSSSQFLVCEYTITATDVSNGYFHNTTVTYDVVPDDGLGAALYTNPEREGIEKSRYVPPISRAAAFFNRCIWYGDTQSKYRLSAAMKSVGRTLDFVGDLSSGTDTITAVVDTTGLRIGMFVCDTQSTPRSVGTSLPARTYITAISGPGPGAVVTISQNATGSAATVGLAACDWVDPSVTTRAVTIVGTWTSGTSTIDVQNATGLFNEMLIWDSGHGPDVAGTIFQAQTWITGISGTGPFTLTLSKTLTASGAGTDTANISDILLIGGRQFFTGPDTGSTYGPSNPTNRGLFEVGATPGITIMYLAQAVNYDSTIGNYAPNFIPTGTEAAYGALASGDFTIEGYRNTSPGVMSGNPNSDIRYAFLPDIGNYSNSSASSNDRRTGRVMWSAPDEPDGVPLPNFVDIGSSSNVVLALVPLRASMLVFTSEGLYRIAGVPADAWSADLIDPTVVLVSRNAVDVIDNTAFAWTTRGVVAVDESGFVDVSTGAIGRRLDVYARAVLAGRAAGAPLHAWVETWREQHLVLVGCSTDATNGETDEVFVYNTQSRAWSSWPVQLRRVSDAAGYLFAARGDKFITSRSAESGPASIGHDLSWAIAAFTIGTDPTHILISAADYAPWRPRVGDYLRATGSTGISWRRIVAFGSGLFIISRPFDAGVVAVVRAFEVASVDLRWTPSTAGALQGFHQRWREGCVTLDVSEQVDNDDEDTATMAIEIEPGFGTDTDQVPESTNRKIVRVPRPTIATLPIRFGIQRQGARAALVWPRFKMAAIGWAARIYGVTMQRLGASEKVRR